MSVYSYRLYKLTKNNNIAWAPQKGVLIVQNIYFFSTEEVFPWVPTFCPRPWSSRRSFSSKILHYAVTLQAIKKEEVPVRGISLGQRLFLHTQPTWQIGISISVVCLLIAFQSLALATVLFCSTCGWCMRDSKRPCVSYSLFHHAKRWRDSLASLHTTMWVQRHAQPALYPPYSHASLGFSNWLPQIIECLMRSTLIRHVHLYITSLIWLSPLPAFCVNTNCIWI